MAALLAVAPLALSPGLLPAAALGAAPLELLLVGYEPGASPPTAALEGLGAAVVRVDHLLGFAVVAAPPGFAAAARALPGVAYVETDDPIRPLGIIGTEELQGEQWGLDAVRAPQAWALLPDEAAPVTIAVLDTGADWNHPDLSGAVWNGNGLHGDDLTAYAVAGHCALDGWRAPQCFYLKQPPEDVLGPMDFHGHGTHVAGIAAATRDGAGMVGVSQAQLRIVKVMPAGNSVFSSIDVVATGIALAAQNGAHIISLSLGCWCASQTLSRAVDYAWAEGALLVAAAGNSDDDRPLYPAAFRNVISVAAVDRTLGRWLAGPGVGSSYGPTVDLAAPGAAILSAQSRWAANFGYHWVGLGYKNMSGTSMATPFVAGVAALVWSNAPHLTNEAVRDILEGSARDLGAQGRDPYFGAGLVDAEAAVRRTMP